MALMVCGNCSVAYLPAGACPHCGGDSFRFDWEEEDMPRATVEGGPSGHDVELVDLSGDAREVIRKAMPEPKPKPAAKKTPVSKPSVADAAEDED